MFQSLKKFFQAFKGSETNIPNAVKAIVPISVLGLMAIAVTGFLIAQNAVQTNTKNLLQLTSESKSEQFILTIEKMETRVSDWATDGKIRADIERIIDGGCNGKQGEACPIVSGLEDYIVTKKMPIDTLIEEASITDQNGIILVSTNKRRVGEREQEGGTPVIIKKAFEQAFGTQVAGHELVSFENETDQAHADTQVLHVASPIVSVTSERHVGVLLLDINMKSLTEESVTAKNANISTYIVGPDRNVLVAPPGDPLLLLTAVNLPPVNACIDSQRAYQGSYADVGDATVTADSHCLLLPEPFTIFTEIPNAAIIQTTWVYMATESGMLMFLVIFIITIGITATRSMQNAYAKTRTFADIVETSFEGIAITNPKGIITYVNQSWQRLTGWSSEEVVGKTTPRILKSGAQSDDFYENMWKQISHGTVFRAEFKNRRKDGSFYNVEEILMPIKDVRGNVSGFVGFQHDITRRKEIEETLRSTNDLLTNTFTSSPLPIIVTSLDATVRTWSPAAEQLFGWTTADVIGRSAPYVPKEKQLESKKLREGIARGDQLHGIELKRLRKDGVLIDVRAWTGLLKDANGNAIGIVTLYEDITEQKASQSHIKELDQLRQRFLEIISHQLRTPLNAIRWNLETILSGQFGTLKPEQEEYLRTTYDANIEILGRIRDVLAAMDIEEGRSVMTIEDVKIEPVLKKFSKEWKKTAIKKHIALQDNSDVGATLAVKCDHEKLEYAITTLIDNAFTYTNDGGTVTVEANQDGNLFHFSVTDTGVGIPNDEQHFIFTKFFRASNASVMKTDATGLSLSIVKNYIETMGGRVGFKSTIGEGSTFWFELPIAAV